MRLHVSLILTNEKWNHSWANPTFRTGRLCNFRGIRNYTAGFIFHEFGYSGVSCKKWIRRVLKSIPQKFKAIMITFQGRSFHLKGPWARNPAHCKKSHQLRFCTVSYSQRLYIPKQKKRKNCCCNKRF